MKVLYVNSGPNPIHEPLDRYIHLTFREMDIDYKLYDLTAHISFFNTAFDCTSISYDIACSPSSLLKYAAAPLLQLVSEFEPDLVFTMGGKYLPKGIVQSIRKMGAMTALWAVDDPYKTNTTLEVAEAYDYIFTVETAVVNLYREAGCAKVYQLPLAAFSKVHKKIIVPQFESDICFVGTGYPNRVALFEQIADYLVDKGLSVRIMGRGWESLASHQKLGEFVSNNVVYAPDAARYYAGAKINLNIHRLPDAKAYVNGDERDIEALTPNNRTFEIAACGGFQLIDNSRPELYRHFDIGHDVDIFSTADELIRKIDFYLENNEKREEMARNAKERALRDHTFRSRLEFILDKTLRRDDRNVIYQVIETFTGDHPNFIRKDSAYYERVHKTILKTVPPTVKRVLDVGCGEGLLGEMLKSIGVKEVIGVDINDALAARAKGRLDRVIIGDVEEVELPFRNNYFDCIIYNHVLEHLKDPRRLLTRQKRFLTPDGQLCASISNTLYFPIIKELLKGRWRYDKSGLLDSNQLRFFTLREIVHMFKWAGYEIETVEGFGGSVDLDEVTAFIKKIKALDIIPESLAVETQYCQYLIVARKARSDIRQGVNLSLVKS